MIIFYNKENGEIIGTIAGRVHDEDHHAITINPANLDENLIGKYTIPFKDVYETQDFPVKELRADATGLVTEVVVRIEKREVATHMEPDTNFNDLITDFEMGRKNVLDYKLILNKDEVIDIVRK